MVDQNLLGGEHQSRGARRRGCVLPFIGIGLAVLGAGLAFAGSGW